MTVEQAIAVIRRAGYEVTVIDAKTVKVEGYTPMTHEGLIRFAREMHSWP